MANFTKEEKLEIAGHIRRASELLLEAGKGFTEEDMKDGTGAQVAQLSTRLLGAMKTIALGYQSEDEGT